MITQKIDTTTTLAGIILAGGASGRMGSPKAIMPWGANTFLQAVSNKMRQAGVAPIFVILGTHYRQVRSHCRSCGALAIYNHQWQIGQFSSLRLGASRVPRAVLSFNPDQETLVTGVMLALIDQPHIAFEVFWEVAAVSRKFPEMLILPTFNQRRGHPLVIPRRLLPALMAMPATATTRDFLRAHQACQLLVPVSDAGIHFDIDTVEDLLIAKERYQV
jgi:molybdenum cofactor cytidylyltransferase